MTVAIAGLGLGVSLLLAGFITQLGHTAVAAARAQTAADSAALAAVAEGTPYGSGEPGAAAARFARANGAELVECRCQVGASAAEVEVVVDGVVRAARAVLNPELVSPTPTGVVAGLDPLLADAVDRLVRASRGAVRVVSGYRSAAEQAALWADAIDRYGDPEAADDWVARPGTSAHERGLAVDLGGDLVLAAELVDVLDLPLVRPLDHEPWHFELDPVTAAGSEGPEP